MNTMKCQQLPGRVGICMYDTIETAFYTVYAARMYQKISGTSGKNHFHETNGDVGMAG